MKTLLAASAFLFGMLASASAQTSPTLDSLGGGKVVVGPGGIAAYADPRLSTRTPFALKSGTTPAVDFAKSKASSNPIYCIIGDSTGTLNAANNIYPTDLLWGKLQKRIREDNPTKTLSGPNFLNFSIGGTVLSQGIGVYGGPTYPAFYTNHSATWLSYLQTAGCTTVFLNFGINDAGNQSGTMYATLYATLAAWSAPPDLIFITPAMANPAAGAPFNTTTYTQGTILNATWQSTLSRSNQKFATAGAPHVGLIDINRFFNMMVNGFDPQNQYLSYVITPQAPVYNINPATTPSYTLPANPGGDLAISITVPGTGSGAAMSTAGTYFQVPLGSNTGGPFAATTIVFSFATGGAVIYANVYINGAASALNAGAAGLLSPNSNTVSVALQDDHLQITLNGTITYDGLIPRFNGPQTGANAPVINMYQPFTNMQYQIDYYAVGNPLPTNTTMTPYQVWGDGNGDGLAPISGNGINHDASPSLNWIYGQVLENTQF